MQSWGGKQVSLLQTLPEPHDHRAWAERPLSFNLSSVVMGLGLEYRGVQTPHSLIVMVEQGLGATCCWWQGDIVPSQVPVMEPTLQQAAPRDREMDAPCLRERRLRWTL